MSDVRLIITLIVILAGTVITVWKIFGNMTRSANDKDWLAHSEQIHEKIDRSNDKTETKFDDLRRELKDDINLSSAIQNENIKLVREDLSKHIDGVRCDIKDMKQDTKDALDRIEQKLD